MKPATPVMSIVRPSSFILSVSMISVSSEYVAGVYFVLYVVEAGVVTVGDDGLRLILEFFQIVDNNAAEEGAAVLKRRFIDDYLGAFGLDTLHHALDGGLAEVVAVGFHCQTIDTDDAWSLVSGIILAVGRVITRHSQNLVGDEVLAGTVALDDGAHHVLGNVGVVGKELLGVLRQTVATVAERGVVVVRADTWVKADALDDGLRVEALDFGVGIELVEVAHAKCKIGVGEEFHSLSLLHAHVKHGDVFLDCALLERAARMNDEHGGGSLTALPIIETQAGDVSAYIPTNVISITDGQIYLETEMFHEGFRPAVNAGLSVSRVGGSAQIKAMKKIAAPIRVELAQYRELAAFSQFGSELDADTREKLAQGERIREVLKQPQYQPMPVEYQVITLYVATGKYLLDVEVDQITRFEQEFFTFLDKKYPEVPKAIRTEKVISDETDALLKKAITEFKAEFK